MKILQIISSLGEGGAEKLLLDSIPLYIQQGIDMDLLVLNGDEYPFLQELKKKGVHIYSLSKGPMKKIYNPMHIFKIIPYLRRYDIAHVHLFPELYWVALAKILSNSSIKLLHTEHNVTNRRRKDFLLKRIDKYIYKKYDLIISITDEVNNNLKKHLNINDNNKFYVINNGINISQFIQKIESHNIERTNKILIQISRFKSQKDQDTVIKALQYLPEYVKLYLVGDGERRNECEILSKQLNLSHRVKFLGIRTDVAELLKSADITLLSSYYEGLSLSSLECMASGKPFIASDVPGLRDIVQDAGILFPQGDEKKLAQCINDLLKDKNYYNEVSSKCIERAKQYDINKMIDKYVEIYNRIGFI